MHATTDFTLTAAEQSFLYHYNRETCIPERGPAIEWLAQNNLSGGAMTAFQYWAERNDPEFLNRTLFDPLPSFEVPWASRDEFAARVYEIMEIYPVLKDWKFAQP